MTAHRQIHELGMFVHGVLAALHFLGLAYNLQRRNWFDVVAHASALVYDAHAVRTHVRQVRQVGP